VHGYSNRAFVMTLATGAEHAITPFAYENTFLHPLSVSWAADGSSLAVLTCVEPLFIACGRTGIATVAPDGTGLVAHWERPERSALDAAWAASPRR
jgi:hypothetical protein